MKKIKFKTNVFKLAFRNLSRHKVKTIITISAISLGIFLYLGLDAWLLGMNIDSKRNLVNYETGAAKIYSKAYFEKKDELPLYESFNNYKSIINKLNEAGYDAVPHAVFVGTLLSPDQELPFKFIGLDPDIDSKVFRYQNFLEKDGSKFIQNNKYEIVLGVKGAKDLKVKVGDTVRLSTVIDKKDDTGKIKHINQLIELNVCGLINSPNPVTNGNIGYLPLSILQDESGLLLEGSITEICIRKKNASDTSLPGWIEKPKNIIKKIGSDLPSNLIVAGWQEDAKDYIAVSNSDNVFNRLIIIFFLIITLVGIANTMLMAVLERTKEIGMLRALGMTDFSIIKLFLIEAGMIGFIGSIIGMILSIILGFYMVNYGVDFTSLYEKTGVNNFGYRVLGIYKAAWNYTTMIGALILGPIFASITAFFPSLRAIKITIIDALRFE